METKLAREMLAGAVAAGDTVRPRYDRQAGVWNDSYGVSSSIGRNASYRGGQ